MLFLSCNFKSDEAKVFYQNAKEFFETEDYANASIEIDKAIELDSTNLDFYILSADIRRLMDDEDIAIELLKIPQIKNFKLDTVNYKIGKCYFSKSVNLNYKGASNSEQNDNLKKSIDYYTNALNENIKYYDAYVEKYKALHNLEKYEEAIVLINKAYSVFPDSLNLILYRGVAKGTLGDTSEEINDLNQVINSKSLDSTEMSTAYRWRGLAHKKKGDYELALEDLTKSINWNNDNSFPYKDRADLYLQMKKTDSACKDYRKAVNLGLVKLYEVISENCK